MKCVRQKTLSKILGFSKSKTCRVVKMYREDNGLKPYTPIVWELFAEWIGVPVELGDRYLK